MTSVSDLNDWWVLGDKVCEYSTSSNRINQSTSLNNNVCIIFLWYGKVIIIMILLLLLLLLLLIIMIIVIIMIMIIIIIIMHRLLCCLGIQVFGKWYMVRSHLSLLETNFVKMFILRFGCKERMSISSR